MERSMRDEEPIYRRNFTPPKLATIFKSIGDEMDKRQAAYHANVGTTVPGPDTSKECP
jgi:hypothetical protein